MAIGDVGGAAVSSSKNSAKMPRSSRRFGDGVPNISSFGVASWASGKESAPSIFVLAALSSLADVSPSLRGPTLSSTDEGVLVDNGDGFVVDRSNSAKICVKDLADGG